MDREELKVFKGIQKELTALNRTLARIEKQQKDLDASLVLRVSMTTEDEKTIVHQFESKVYAISGNRFLVYDPGDSLNEKYPCLRWVSLDDSVMIPGQGREVEDGKFKPWYRPAIEKVND